LRTKVSFENYWVKKHKQQLALAQVKRKPRGRKENRGDGGNFRNLFENLLGTTVSFISY